jgi:hypothetical protein
MSFSFAIRAVSIAACLPLAKAKMEEVVAAQPAHAFDAALILETAERYLALASEPNEGAELLLQMHGSVWFSGDDVLGGLSGGVSISYVQAPNTVADSDGDDGA